MESESLQPHVTPERPDFSRSEQSEKLPVQTPETGLSPGVERYEQRSEDGTSADNNGAPMFPTPVPFTPPPMQAQASDAAGGVTTQDDNPPIANDDDLIEKEWVDKAKKIIVETKDDPYRREQAVSRLQQDYLEKRYGRKIGSADEAA